MLYPQAAHSLNKENMMVGAEGFEGSFPSDHDAVFFVEFDCKTAKFQGLARILRHAFLSRIFAPVDKISQKVSIPQYHPTTLPWKRGLSAV